MKTKRPKYTAAVADQDSRNPKSDDVAMALAWWAVTLSFSARSLQREKPKEILAITQDLNISHIPDFFQKFRATIIQEFVTPKLEELSDEHFERSLTNFHKQIKILDRPNVTYLEQAMQKALCTCATEYYEGRQERYNYRMTENEPDPDIAEQIVHALMPVIPKACGYVRNRTRFSSQQIREKLYQSLKGRLSL